MSDFQTHMKLEREARENAKPGDVFLAFNGRDYSNLQEIKVERTTATQIVLANGIRLKKDTGSRVSQGAGGFSYTVYRPDLPHIRADIAEANTERSLDQNLKATSEAVNGIRYRHLNSATKRALLADLQALLAKYPKEG